MPNMYNDSPINDAKHFNFDIYAQSIAKIVLNKNNKTPFTIAINGKWGSGKTTLMKTIRNQLKSSSSNNEFRNVKTVWFDAWKYSECDSMLAALVLEILEEIERQGFVNNLKNNLSFATENMNKVEIIKDLFNKFTHSSATQNEWSQTLECRNKLSFSDIFRDIMGKILRNFIMEKDENDFTDKKGVLVIFIDDLDRCSPKNIVNVLESINLFLDLEGCFFIIGTDVTVISNAIDCHYKDIKNFSGLEYIKKMIQLSFDLPLLKSEDISHFMESELGIDPELKKYLTIIVNGLNSNPRELKRFLNSLSLMKILGESFKEEGYDDELLIKWSVLNLSSPDFIEEVRCKSNLLNEFQTISQKKSENEKNEYINNLVDSQIKKNYKRFSKCKNIFSVLEIGEKEFTQDNIDTFLFLSKIAPKELDTENISFIYDIRPGAILDKADFCGAELIEKKLMGASLKNALMIGVDLRKSDLTNADLTGANLMSAKVMEANLQGAWLVRTDITDADLTGVNFERAKLIKTKMMNATLINAKLTNTDLTGADLSRANLINSDFTGASILGTDFQNAKFSSSTLRSIKSCKDWKQATFDEVIKNDLQSI